VPKLSLGYNIWFKPQNDIFKQLAENIFDNLRHKANLPMTSAGPVKILNVRIGSARAVAKPDG
jgi:hypothetical protein